MAKKKKSQFIETKDYRHTGEKRKNVPLAKIASEGEVPKVKKVRYYYSPHLAPEFRFDPEDKADRVMAVKEKVSQYLNPAERELLDRALTNQQPWLEWAGKKEQYDRSCFEVDPVALHIHERISAQAIVKAAMREDLQRDLFADPQLPYQKEVQFYQHNVDWANRLILGDSLHVMSSLARRENLAGKVQMIYFDPPYGIRFASNFQSQIKQRDVRDKIDDMTREPEMVKAYRDTWELGIHSYLSYLKDRLIVAKELLHQTGSIFIQIGEDNQHRIRVLLDEVFGAENYITVISYKTSIGLGAKYLDSVANYLVWYSKSKSDLKFKRLFKQVQIGLQGATRYNMAQNEFGESRALADSEINNPELIPSNWKPFFKQGLTSRTGSDTTRFSVNFEDEKYIPTAGGWRTNEIGLNRLIEADRVLIEGKRLTFRKRFDDFGAIAITNFWDDVGGGIQSRTDPKIYVVQTATSIIQRCILMTTDPGDIILDPTCGSGTTAYVAEQWGRRWLSIDTSRVSIALARQRILTANYDYYKLLDEKIGISRGLYNKTVPHITLKNIARNQNLDPIFLKHAPILENALFLCNNALENISEDIRKSLRKKLFEKQNSEGKRSVTDADKRRWILPRKGEKWQVWEVPFDTDPDWPKELQNAVVAYRKAWAMKMKEVNACITNNTDQEDLVDQPEVVRGVVRVSGPFTVEGVRPEELSLREEVLFDATSNESQVNDVADEVQNFRAYLSSMVELIRKDGITFPNNRHQDFQRVEPLYEESTGSLIHAEALWKDLDGKEPNNIGITFGPQYGPVTAEQVADIIRSGRRYDELIIAGFSFDAAALDAIQENQHPKQKIHIAHIRPDVSPGMDGLLKDTPNSQLFTVFGQPEIEVKQTKDGDFTVELVGVDIYDPLTGEVRSSKADKVAAWFLDSDYDGKCFCITQAFFPDQNAWEKIAKSLSTQSDPDVFEAFNGTKSIPFKPGEHKRIAVKVIDPRGNEVIAIARLEQEKKR